MKSQCSQRTPSWLGAPNLLSKQTVLMLRGITSCASCALNKRSPFREAVLLLILAGLIAGLASLWHPWAPTAGKLELSMEDAGKRSWLWVDARAGKEYLAGHIPGAVNVNEDDWESGLQKLMSTWRPGRPILVYCSTARCRSSHSLARRIRRSLGTEDIYVLRGGWEAWQQNQSR
jgi:rhodanese-related sulfurtransferase